MVPKCTIISYNEVLRILKEEVMAYTELLSGHCLEEVRKRKSLLTYLLEQSPS